MDFKEHAKKIVSKMTISEKVSQLMDEAPAIERLDIPEYNWWNEGLHGVARSGLATSFPQAIGLAATFNLELMNNVANAISDEARAKYNQFKMRGDYKRYQGLTIWSPNINIFRDPRWGRGHETYGEDPCLTTEMAVQFIKGLQGDEDYDYRKCDATLKHFAAHSGPEMGRENFDSKVNDKDLYETYLYAFKECIKRAKPASVMSAYNAINGIPASCNKWLLTDVLRNEFGFDGYVVSDCGAICNIFEYHRYFDTKQETAAASLKAGCDLNCGKGFNALLVALLQGLITEENLDRALVRLYESRLRLGMPADGVAPKIKYDDIPYSVVESDKHKKIALNAAKESVVLLENNGLLPLYTNLNIAVVGCNASAGDVFLANYNGTPTYVNTIPQSIAKYNKGVTKFSLGCRHTSMSEYDSVSDATILAENSDVIVYCVGLTPRMEGEAGDGYNSDAGGDKTSLKLPQAQYDVFDEMVKTGKPIVVVNITGSAVLLDHFKEKASAVIQFFYAGQMAADALSEILFGVDSPSGKLPITFYASDSDLPAFDNYDMMGRTYRYFNGKVLYPFGYGLSYSKFEYKNFSLSNNVVGFSIHNVGDVDASEVWQVYIKSAEPNQPNISLKKFGKVFIKKGESADVFVELTKEMFNLVGEDGNIFISKNCYDVLVGASCEDIKNTFKISPVLKVEEKFGELEYFTMIQTQNSVGRENIQW